MNPDTNGRAEVSSDATGESIAAVTPEKSEIASWGRWALAGVLTAVGSGAAITPEGQSVLKKTPEFVVDTVHGLNLRAFELVDSFSLNGKLRRIDEIIATEINDKKYDALLLEVVNEVDIPDDTERESLLKDLSAGSGNNVPHLSDEDGGNGAIVAMQLRIPKERVTATARVYAGMQTKRGVRNGGIGLPESEIQKTANTQIRTQIEEAVKSARAAYAARHSVAQH